MSVLPSVRDEPWTELELDGLDDRYSYEIVDGRLLVSPRPANSHARTVSRLFRALAAVLPPELELLIEPRLTLPSSSRSPDLVVIVADDVDWAGVNVTPDQLRLAIEVESPSSLGDDRIRKPAEYAAAGIPAYWHVSQDDVPLITVSLLDGTTSRYRTAGGPSPRTELPFAIDLGATKPSG